MRRWNRVPMLRLRLVAALISGGLMAVVVAAIHLASMTTALYPYAMSGPILVAVAASVGFWLGEEAAATHRTRRFVLRSAFVLVAAGTLAGGAAMELLMRLNRPPEGIPIGAGLQWAFWVSLFYSPISFLIAIPVVGATMIGTRRLLRRYWSALSR